MTPLAARVVALRHALRGWDKGWRLLLVLGILAVVAVAILYGVLYREQWTDVRKAGYLGIFLIALLGSAALVVPVPHIAAIFAGGHLLNPVLVALVAGSAEGIGEVTGYLLGIGGRGLLEEGRYYKRVEGWVRRRGWIVIFLFSLVPNPIFDVVGVAAGALRFPYWAFLLASWAGKTLKDLGLAYAGYFGVEPIMNFFGGVHRLWT